jgi:hypothetical protein
MKKRNELLFLLCSFILVNCFCVTVTFSQGLINNGAYIVNSGAYIVVTGATGNFTNQDAGGFVGKVENTGVIQIAGDWTNNSVQNVFTANTGTVEMNGAAQNFGGTTTTWFNNLALLGSGNKTLNIAELTGGGYPAPAGVLSLNDRPMLLNTNQLTVTNPLTTAITRTTGYIVSEMNSGSNTAIIQWNAGGNNGSYLFPFGTTTAPNYIPLTITKTAGNANILASTRMTTTTNNSPWETSVTQMWSQTIPGPGEVPVVVDRWWDINSTAGFTGAVSFTYRGVENTTTYAPSGTFAAQNWIGTSWNVPTGAGPGVLAGTAVVTIPAQALGSASPWVLSNIDAPLPVELLYFSAKLKGKTVFLNWSTATEFNNSYFEVQRSKDNESFEVIDIINGYGNSSVVRSYDSKDEKPYEGISYYRLRQVDYDGRYSYSETVPVQLNSINDFDFVFASPTPTMEEVIIGFDYNNESSVEVNISDAVGKTISSQMLYPKQGFNRMNINIPRVTSGIYFITLANSAFTTSKKIFVN